VPSALDVRQLVSIPTMQLAFVVAAALAAGIRADEFDTEVAAYEAPAVTGDLALVESFASDPLEDGSWVQSSDSKYEGSVWKYTTEGAGFPGDGAMVMDVAPKFYGLSKVLDAPVGVEEGKEGLVVQYEVRLTKGLTCGGAYLKLIAAGEGFTAEGLNGDSGYSIMFGPDKCGATNKVHVIFRQKNPVSGEWEEKHMSKKVAVKTDKYSHLYTLEVKPDNTFRVLVDLVEEASGSLTSEDDFTPAFGAPEEIDDPEDSKPEDWVDAAKIKDPEASKPEDWDEDAPRQIEDAAAEMPAGWEVDEAEKVEDPAAEKPEDWDDEDDGEWEPAIIANPKCSVGCGEWVRPTISNPEYKGKWSAPMIDNPDYIGVWAPKRIPNANYFKDDTPALSAAPIAAVAIEVLANDGGITFDNIVLGNDLAAAKAYAEATFSLKATEEKASEAEAKRAATKEKREKALEEGGFSGAVEYYLGEAGDFAQQNLIAVGAGVVAIVGLLLYLCLFAGGSDGGAAHKKDDDEEEEDDDEEDEDEDDEDDEEEEEKKKEPTARRRNKSKKSKKTGD